MHEVLLSALVRYHALYPKIKFSLVNLTNTQAISAVKNQAVDFVLISTPFSLDKSLKSVPIKAFSGHSGVAANVTAISPAKK